ncbi:class I SAM-dependent methyltransferase [Vulcanisaeta souniana]|uniref:16S rRNA methyltransferase n=1 Tax=Vulcanisaeta souniana JCM 11219 TaxID=1293586 RepID=A0A830E4Y1_9CREN|nr:methyltransferase [Vulcanisaeta souniana]BDR91631.1 16S rRNA methyltransferase [Vulcanisaeta souniana JCM 11219]GGI71734.1 16S rRNA methyltransferase [Vulcanisaeta souniana JCM 11219]
MHYYDKEPVFKEMRVRRIRDMVRGMPLNFVSAPSVFSGEYIDAGTRLLAENMVIMNDWDVLDMGCGYGVLGIVAAKLAPRGRVVMVDTNKLAVKLAAINIRINNVDNAEVRWGDLYGAVQGERFNTVISNPPITAGLEVNRRLIIGAREHLKPGGLLQIVIPKKLRSRFEEILYGNYDIVERLAKSGNYIAYVAKVMDYPPDLMPKSHHA